ncbi:hypothetical protein KNZ44_004511 [Escherichia coli]|nr:hypothetical protein [Escherichia coli]
MKKTLIALAVAASAAVSGSAMAWTANGTGGPVDLGGTLTPVERLTPWEVSVGNAVTNLNAEIIKGQSVVDINVEKAIPVLGIRTQSNQVFVGQQGISPRIDFNSAVDVNGFTNSVSTLTLDVNGVDGNKIGTMKAPFFAAAATSKVAIEGSFSKLWSTFASGNDRSFGGGLPKNDAGVASDSLERAALVFPGAADNFNTQSIDSLSQASNADTFADPAYKYSAFYSSGIEQGNKINIVLDNPAEGDEPVEWKASLPVTVSYQ